MSPQEPTPQSLRPTGEGPASQAPAPADESSQEQASPDLQALAEQILRLIMEEARLELERKGWRRTK